MANWRTQLHPELVDRIDALIARAAIEGHDIRVVSAYRSHAEQDKLFLKRPRVTKARGGQSWHNYGLAADLAPFIDGAISWDEKKFNWSLIGKWANAVDLEWGGNWKSFKDRPHVQLIEDLTTDRASALYKAAGNKLTKVWEYISDHAEPADDLQKLETLNSAAVSSTAVPTQSDMSEPATSTETIQPVSVEMNSSQPPIETSQTEVTKTDEGTTAQTVSTKK